MQLVRVKDEKGLSFIEVMVAILVLGVTIIPLINFFRISSTFSFTARQEVGALNFTQSLLEEIKGVPSKWVGVAGGGGSSQIKLAGDAGNISPGCLVAITSGKGEGQARRIVNYNESTRMAVVEPSWVAGSEPDGTSHYLLGHEGEFGFGTVREASAGTIRLAGAANPRDDFYRGFQVEIAGGSGSGQVRRISSYKGSARVAEIEPEWEVIPDTSSIYKLYRYPYRVEVLNSAGILKTVRVTSLYQDGDLSREVSLTTEKLKR